MWRVQVHNLSLRVSYPFSVHQIFCRVFDISQSWIIHLTTLFVLIIKIPISCRLFKANPFPHSATRLFILQVTIASVILPVLRKVMWWTWWFVSCDPLNPNTPLLLRNGFSLNNLLDFSTDYYISLNWDSALFLWMIRAILKITELAFPDILHSRVVLTHQVLVYWFCSFRYLWLIGPMLPFSTSFTI